MNWYKKAMSEYWGSKASGCLFVCQEDDTILLFLRSLDVAEGGTWGITGGAVPDEFGQDEGFVDSENDEIEDPENEIFEDSARQETREETGTFPSDYDVVGSLDYVDGSFTYRTFIYNLSFQEKELWTPTITLNWENDDYQWFNIDNLPEGLHSGLESKLSEITTLIKREEDSVESPYNNFQISFNLSKITKVS